jgi:predicted membrane-bound spermidine synthase
MAGLLILPATLSLGALFPVVIRVYNEERDSEHYVPEPSVGHLYFLNTVGAVAGCLLTGFWLIPHLGVSATLRIASGAILALAVIVFFTVPAHSYFRRLAYGGSSLAAGLVLMTSLPAFDQFVLNTGIYTEMFSGEFREKMKTQTSPVNEGHLLFVDEGINSSVAVIANKFGGGNLTMHIAGHWVATTEFHGRLHLHVLGHLPMLFAQQTESAAVVGLGTGITAGAILQYPQLKKLDIFEIEPGVVEAAKFYDYINHSPLKDPRTTLFTVDGRSQLTYHPATYDVITADPIHPLSAGSGNLYSSDYYRIVASRLNQGGIFCQWIPLGGISSMAYRTILASIRAEFPYMAMFSFFGESVVLASKQPITLLWEEHQRRYNLKEVREDFESLDMLTPFNLFAFFEAGQDQLEDYLAGHEQTTTDDNVWLEHRMAFDVFDRSLRILIIELRKSFRMKGYESLVQMLPGIPVDRLHRELASLAKDGDRYFRRAIEAFNREDYSDAEIYSRRAFEDLNSKYFYQAGLLLASSLRRTDRMNEAIKVLKRLQTFHPALEEAYQAEALIYAQQGRKKMAEDAVQRGLMFNPSGSKLLKLKDAMYQENGSGVSS